MENANFLSEKERKGSDVESRARSSAEQKPPDGGSRAWLVMVGSFLCNGILFGIINTYSVIYLELQAKLEQAGVADASSKAALVGSLTIGTTFLLSPVSGVLTDAIGLRRTTLLGGALASGGLLLSSFVTHSIEALYFSYGVMYGLGAALAYTPSLAILGHYFSKYLGLVNGIVTAGSSVFTVIMPMLLDYMIKTTGLIVSLRVMALMTSFVMLCAVLFKPVSLCELPALKPKENNFNVILKSLINVDNWKRKKYVIWSLAIPSALFGYFVPYVHMGKFVEVNFPGQRGNLPVMCIGITSGLGRLIFGYIADRPNVNRILLQQISFYVIGIMTICLPFTNAYWLLLTIALAMGLFDGCFISLLGPIAFDICGKKGATQAIGFLLGLCSFPLTIGPPVAGLLYDHNHSYTLPLVLAGIPPLIGATVMFLVTCLKIEPEPIEEEDAKSTLLSTIPKGAASSDSNGAIKQNGHSNGLPITKFASSESLSEKKTKGSNFESPM